MNKVETMVQGSFDLHNSTLLNENQKLVLHQKLKNRINKAGQLLVKSQSDRTQLGNKENVINKMNSLIQDALIKKKSRIATNPTRASKVSRLQSKKRNAIIKEHRKRPMKNDE